MGRVRAVQLATVVLGAVLLYGVALSWAPIHLHYDEVYFADQARAIAETGRDLRGRLFPLYFQMDNVIWFHPVGVYLPALAFTVLPVSIAALRLPSAAIGALDVLLVYFLARRVLRHHWLAVLAAGLLALTPAHFIHSRMALDYLFPTPFALGWAILLLRYCETRSLRALAAATSVLGVGIYSYIAAVALFPLFVLVTLLVLWREQAAPRAFAVAVAGFCWPLIPAALFLSVHPGVFGSTLGRYGIAAGQLDAFQQLRETLTPWFISDRLNLYMSFFAPGFLFVSGSSGLVGSTRMAGIFLAPTLPLMLVGCRAALLKYSPASVIVLAGILLPPIAASVVDQTFTAGRTMTMIPFAIVLAACGAASLTNAKPWPGLAALTGLAGAAVVAIAAAYLVFRLSDGEVSRSAIGLLVLGLGVVALAVVTHRQQKLAAVIVVIAIACAVQFSAFAKDYFGPYQARSAAVFNGNIKGAVLRAVAELDGRQDAPPVYLSSAIARMEWYWRFHLAELGRHDLFTRARPVSDDELMGLDLAPGTLFIALSVDQRARAVALERHMTLVATVTDPNPEDAGPGEYPVYVLFRAP